MTDHKLELSEMTEAQVTEIVLAKHSNDIAIPQCKTGSTFMGSPKTIDVWVLPYSWVKPVRAYEIKVSRADFQRDKKWREYLPYCDHLYFVTPWDLVEKDEVPDPAGLYYVNKDEKRLVMRKRADGRTRTDIPSSIFRYVLFWRIEEWHREKASGD